MFGALLDALDEADSIIRRWVPIANFGGTDYTAEEIAGAASSLAAESLAWRARMLAEFPPTDTP
jgi:hypothetical protein